MSEVASAEPPCRGQEGVHLPRQRPSDDHSRHEGEHQESEQQLSDQQPIPRDLVVDLRSITEHGELDRRTRRLDDSRHSSPVAVARQLELTRIAAGAERGSVAEAVDGGGQQGLFAKHGELEAGQLAHAREEVVGVDPRDAELAGLATPDRQRRALRCDSRARPGASYHLSVAGAQDDRRDVAGLVDELPHALLHAATGPKRRAQARVRGDPAQLGLGALRGLVVDREGGAQAGVDARIGLAGLAATRKDKQHDRERDHGDDHDQREEQPEPGAEAHCGPEYSRGAPSPGPAAPLPWSSHGAIAQLGERLDRTQEVVGSSPTSSIRRTPAIAGVLSFERSVRLLSITAFRRLWSGLWPDLSGIRPDSAGIPDCAGPFPGRPFRDCFESTFADQPDLRFRGRRRYVGDDFVVSEWTATATDAGGRTIEWDGIDVFPFRDGLIARKDVYSGSHAPRLL